MRPVRRNERRGDYWPSDWLTEVASLNDWLAIAVTTTAALGSDKTQLHSHTTNESVA